MGNILEWVANLVQKYMAEDVPEDLAYCEYECRESTCVAPFAICPIRLQAQARIVAGPFRIDGGPAVICDSWTVALTTPPKGGSAVHLGGGAELPIAAAAGDDAERELDRVQPG